jgi:tight adherence protein C
VTPALLLATAAGAVAAAGIVELAAAGRPARPRVSGAFVAALARIGRRIGAPAPPRDLAERIEAAGSPLGLTLSDAMAVKGAGALIALLAGSPLAASLPGRLPIVAALALPAAGWFALDGLLIRRIRRRARQMARELPDLLDLLRVSVEAGLPLQRALAEVGRRHNGPLASELDRASSEISLGVPRDIAMDALARRCPIAGVRALVAAVERAHRHGAPLAGTLAAQAREARAARARRIRERAARAAPKIQLVVALLLVPSVLLLVAAALLASLVR